MAVGGWFAVADERPNIVLILADDLGYSDLGCYGGEIATPRLDQLASEGIRFRNFYNESKCVESRTSIMTGLTHHSSQNLNDRSFPTVAELMKEAGYRTLMVGKWHLTDTPLERGFDRYFGFLAGAVNYWTGEPEPGETDNWRLDDEVYQVPESGFYTTDGFTDRAIEFVDETQGTGEPFFLYVAHNAPHYPLHAYPEDIEKYRGKYLQGWDQIREKRLERMIASGVLPEGTLLSQRDGNVPPWSELKESEKDEYDLLMAVYAAMVDRLDQNVGRLVDALEERGLAENTLILFCTDNGACPYQNEELPESTPGGPDSHRTYNTPWANASNAPLAAYKRYSYEGGIASPLIARWPGQVVQPSGFSDQVGHLIDFLPTFLELAGVEAPENAAGVNLAAAFRGETFERKEPLFWEFRNHHAILEDSLKLVARSGADWQLYDLSTDRMEADDLSEDHKEVVNRMEAKYDAWAASVGAPSHEQCRRSPKMTMPDYNKRLGDGKRD